MTVTATTGVHVALLSLSAAVTAGLAVYALRRPEQGTVPFVGLLAVFTVYTTAQLVGVLTLDPSWRLFWENVQWVGTAFIPVFWTLFVVEYTGYDRLLTRRTVAALSVVPALTVLLTWTNPWHGLVWTQNVVVPVDGLALVRESFGPWFWVFLVYTYALLTVGGAALVRLIWVSDYLYVDQAALLVVGVAVPVVANVLTLTGVTPIAHPALDMTPYAFTVTGLAFGYALFRHRLFDLVPATRQLGPHGAVAQLDAGVVIVDTERVIIYLNRAMADQLGCDPGEALGRPLEGFVDDSALRFDAEDAHLEMTRDDRVFEIRTSPIRDRRDRLVGHTLVSRDVTARRTSERRLARHREELASLADLNAVIRDINRALLSATTRADIEAAVCEAFVDSPRYRAACAADVPTWNGEADRWTVAGSDVSAGPPTLFDADAPVPETVTVLDGETGGDSPWTVVPVVYGRTVYGVFGVVPGRESLDDREREVLVELGELVGHAINAVENRRLLAAEAVVELDLVSTDDGSALAAATERVAGRVALLGLVPGGRDAPVAYLRVEGVPVDRAREALADVADGRVRTVRTATDGGQIEWTVTGETLLDALADRGANVLAASASAGRARYTVEVASERDVRALLDRIRHVFPETTVETKRQHTRAVDRVEGVPDRAVADLTDRQREALEAAYRAGYFDWPRESTAEEVAESLGIAAPTLHAHLRKAERRLFAGLFEE